MEEASLVHVSMERVNIYYEVVISKYDDMSSLNWFVENIRNDEISAKKVIIYCRNVKTVASIYEFFSLSLGVNQFKNAEAAIENRMIAMFHRSTTEERKMLVLSEFKKPSSVIRLVIATSSFEMGLDFPDVSIVVNYAAPRSLESFAQQSGRGGRGIPQAYSLIIYQNASIGKGAATDEMRRFVMTKSECRRKILLDNFSLALNREKDDTFSWSGESPLGCKCCDICREKCSCDGCLVVPWQSTASLEDDESDIEEAMLVDDIMTEEMIVVFKENLKEYREGGYEDEYGQNSIVSEYWNVLVERLITSCIFIHSIDDLITETGIRDQILARNLFVLLQEARKEV